VPSSTILVLETSAEATAAIEGPLTGIGYPVTTTVDPEDAVRRAADFALVIVDVSTGSRSGVTVCREIRGSAALSAIPVLCLSQTDDVEERVRYLEAGADDVVAKPFDPRELEARVEALLVRFQRSRDLAPLVLAENEAVPHRSIIACFSPKGGVGTTMIAVNVAVWLATQAPGRVLLADLDLQFGQVATHLNLKPQLSIAELARDDQSLREPDLLRTYTIRHESGLAVIAAPGTPEAGRLITPEQVNLALSTARTAFSTIVIDAGSNLDERSFAVLERAEAVVIPIVPEIGALKALHSLLEYLTEVGSAATAATFVLNHLFAREMLSMKQIEAAIGAKVEVEIPYDAGLYLKAINEGIPVVRSLPGSPPSRALAKLAAAATGGSDGSAPEPDDRRGRLGGFRRRAQPLPAGRRG
jgi:pilus assembly protein CpaE